MQQYFRDKRNRGFCICLKTEHMNDKKNCFIVVFIKQNKVKRYVIRQLHC